MSLKIAIMPPDSSEEIVSGESDSTTPKETVVHQEVPLVELKLQNVTYAPLTNTATASGGGPLSRCRRGASPEDNHKKRTTVLRNISTTLSPFKLTAWMGPSGSGKSSLCAVAANLTAPGDVRPGSLITANGEEGRLPKRLVGVVWQDDLLLSNLTVQENIYFAARLKTPQDVPDDQVTATVEETMQQLGLFKVRNSLVGGLKVRGISGGERKRVSVACELVVRPSLLLLDEPTSGLDATTALALTETLRDLAQQHGHSIAVVIHQPRTTIFNAFDHLLLLSKGRMLYDGPPQQIRTYLEESCPTVPPLPPETGIADWLMDVVTQDEQRSDGGVLAQHWEECSKTSSSGEHSSCLKSEDSTPSTKAWSHTKARRMSSLRELHAAPRYNTGFRKQLHLLTTRTLKQQRGERLTLTAGLLQVTYLVFTALLWWRMPNTTDWIFERNSLLFFMLIAQANGIVINAVTVFQQERALLKRERAKKLYGVSPYFLAKTVSDMTNNVLLPVVYGAIVYWTAGFRPTAPAYFQFLLAFYASLSAAQSMGLWLSIAIPSTPIALILAPPITLFFMILGGFYIPYESMHPGIEWASWLSFARYGYSAMIINEYQGRDIPCSDSEEGAVTIGECPLPGEEVLHGLGITGIAENYWFNVGMVVVLQLVFRFAAYWLLRRSK